MVSTHSTRWRGRHVRTGASSFPYSRHHPQAGDRHPVSYRESCGDTSKQTFRLRVSSPRQSGCMLDDCISGRSSAKRPSAAPHLYRAHAKQPTRHRRLREHRPLGTTLPSYSRSPRQAQSEGRGQYPIQGLPSPCCSHGQQGLQRASLTRALGGRSARSMDSRDLFRRTQHPSRHMQARCSRTPRRTRALHPHDNWSRARRCRSGSILAAGHIGASAAPRPRRICTSQRHSTQLACRIALVHPCGLGGIRSG